MSSPSPSLMHSITHAAVYPAAGREPSYLPHAPPYPLLTGLPQTLRERPPSGWAFTWSSEDWAR